MGAALALVVIAVVVGGMGLAGTGPAEGLLSGSTSRTSGIPTSPVAAPSTAPSTVPPVRTRTPTPTPTPTYAGNQVVAVAVTAAQDRRTPAVVDLLTRYFVSINERDFTTYRALFAADVRDDLDVDQLAEGYRSTYDSNVQLLALTDMPDGRVAARVRFMSSQDAADGPEGLTCTTWDIGLFLQSEQERMVIGAPPEDYRATYRAC